MQVAGYVRVSTEQQREEGSHKRQRERLRDWAEREGHDLTLFEDLAISGQSDERPEFEDMMKRATAGEFDLVVVRELSRFGRSLRKVLDDIKDLNEAGCEFQSITESFNTDSAMGKAMMQMIGVFNEFWANLARERAIEEIERKREQGEQIGRPSKATDEEKEKIRQLRQDGYSLRNICILVEQREDFDIDEISKSTVERYTHDIEV